jgi:hypothetical protein
MAHSSRARTVSLLVLAGAALVPLAVSLGACGGGEQPPVTPTAPSASAPPPASSSAPAVPPASASAAASETVSAPPPPPPPPAPTSTVASVKTDGSWAPCHQTYTAKNKDVSKDVASMAKGCEAATKMKLVGKTLTGKQADQDKPQSYPLAAKANHCYRVYAQAAEGIKDLDVAVKDSAGIIVGQDSTDDPSPVVTEDGAVCFSKDDAASVVVSVGMGSGAYAVQIWGN